MQNFIFWTLLLVTYWILNAILVTVVATVINPSEMKSRRYGKDLFYSGAVVSMIFAPLGIITVSIWLIQHISGKFISSVVNKTIELQEPPEDTSDPKKSLLRGSSKK